MELPVIRDYAGFCRTLPIAGFALAGGADEGIFSIASCFGPEIRSHTGDPETDPWIWRVRAPQEGGELLYGKFFFQKGGWIARGWLPDFLAVRRSGRDFADFYAAGEASRLEKRIYEALSAGPLPQHILKRETGCGREDAAAFERALARLQGRLFLIPYGECRKRSKKGEPYGWPVTIYDLPERVFGEALCGPGREISPRAAAERIAGRILELNPAAQERDIRRFLTVI